MKRYLAAAMWTAALLALFFMDSSVKGISLCIFKFIGFESCWGCGIGHSIHHTLHLRFEAALQHHLLGIPATLVIIWHILQPFTKHTSYESTTVHDARTGTR